MTCDTTSQQIFEWDRLIPRHRVHRNTLIVLFSFHTLTGACQKTRSSQFRLWLIHTAEDPRGVTLSGQRSSTPPVTDCSQWIDPRARLGKPPRRTGWMKRSNASGPSLLLRTSWDSFTYSTVCRCCVSTSLTFRVSRKLVVSVSVPRVQQLPSSLG